jgi:hypothetical protein
MVLPGSGSMQSQRHGVIRVDVRLLHRRLRHVPCQFPIAR